MKITQNAKIWSTLQFPGKILARALTVSWKPIWGEVQEADAPIGINNMLGTQLHSRFGNDLGTIWKRCWIHLAQIWN